MLENIIETAYLTQIPALSLIKTPLWYDRSNKRLPILHLFLLSTSFCHQTVGGGGDSRWRRFDLFFPTFIYRCIYIFSIYSYLYVGMYVCISISSYRQFYLRLLFYEHKHINLTLNFEHSLNHLPFDYNIQKHSSHLIISSSGKYI